MVHKSLVRHLTNSVVEELIRRGVPLASSRQKVTKFLQNSTWEDAVDGIFPVTEEFSCGGVLEIALPLIREVCPKTPEEGWMAFSHRYIQSVMFPDAPCFTDGISEYRWGAVCYLSVLQVFFNYEADVIAFHPFRRFRLLSPSEFQQCDIGEEYGSFLSYYKEEFIYELMRLGEELTPFRTLGHIGGVHHVAMTVAQGLKQSGSLIDLALVSGAALSHDFGKFGCRPKERVPYLHYFYTDQWLTERGLDSISHIASNHSTWDLELEALSAESLCLIYADFRSKQERGPNGEEITVLFPLKEAFDVILDKLDNVDPSKKRRYQLVYSRLRDFEDYLCQIGVDISLEGAPLSPIAPIPPALMTAHQTVSALSLLSVEHSLHVMHLLSHKDKFGNIIESARSVQNHQELRAFLEIFRNYFTYLSIEQKTQTLSFLYELLVHREGDIRRQAGALMGQIIAKFHLVYRKELPDHVDGDPAEETPFALWRQYLSQIIFPDHRTTTRQRSQIGYTLKLAMDSILLHGRKEDIPRFVEELLLYYKDPTSLSNDTAFTLLDAIRELPPQHYSEETRGELISFASHFKEVGRVRLHTAVLQFFLEAQRSLPRTHPQMKEIVEITKEIPDSCMPIIFLKSKVLKRAGEDITQFTKQLEQKNVTGELFLDNLKTATPWVVKVAGVNQLRETGELGDPANLLHIVTHFSNLLKTSEQLVVRMEAGEAFVRLIPRLTRDERNEVVVELGRGLEMGQHYLTNYIPQYLGEAALFLSPNELDEFITGLHTLLGSSNQIDSTGAIYTACVMLEHYPRYQNRFPQHGSAFEARRNNLLGILMQGLAHYNEGVQQVTLLSLANLLDSKHLHPTETMELFSLCYRKMFFLIREGKHTHGSLTFFFRASALAAINRFISIYQLDFNHFTFKNPRRIAFFPGTFDPFTLSHKGIVESICNLGFDVFLAIDEFSWSKKSQPHLIRRQIVNLSVADLFQVHLFPFHIPVNIANPKDLERLQSFFPDQEVYLVVGSDVVQHASSYRLPPSTYSVHNMNHVIFQRAGEPDLTQEEKERLKGDIIVLGLPPHLEDISSTRIRENVDLNRDISSLIHPIVQDFIYQNGLYLRDFQDKQLIDSPDLFFSWVECPSKDVVKRWESVFERDLFSGKGEQYLLLEDAQFTPLGYLSYRYLTSDELFSALQDVQLANRLRLRSQGKMILITGACGVSGMRDYLQIIFAELLITACGEMCVYGIFRPRDNFPIDDVLEDTLTRQGFLRYEGTLP
ncbi:MAG: cytidyltransferase-related domain protein, partial [Eubacteriales bacterium]